MKMSRKKCRMETMHARRSCCRIPKAGPAPLGAKHTDTETIYQRILAAIMERRRPSSSKMAQDRMAAAYGVRRSVREAREVFEVRRLIEPATPAQRGKLRGLATAEAAARAARNRHHLEHVEGALDIKRAPRKEGALKSMLS